MFCCGLCRLEREDCHAQRPAPDRQQQAAPAQLEMIRGKSQTALRVMQLKEGGDGFYRSQSLPSMSLLLAASKRRLLAAQQQEAAAVAAQQETADGAAALSFVQQYMEAIKEGNASWAAQPAVGQLFLEDARMVAADRQSFQGRAAIVRRLNQGVETLAKMAGEQPELPEFELVGPAPDPAGGLAVKLVLRRGLQRMAFTLHFTMQQGRIALLRNTRS